MRFVLPSLEPFMWVSTDDTVEGTSAGKQKIMMTFVKKRQKNPKRRSYYVSRKKSIMP